MQWQDQDQPKADGTTFCTSGVEWLVLAPKIMNICVFDLHMFALAVTNTTNFGQIKNCYIFHI